MSSKPSRMGELFSYQYKLVSSLPAEELPQPKRVSAPWDTEEWAGRRQSMIDTFMRTHTALLEKIDEVGRYSATPTPPYARSHLMVNAYARLWDIPETVCRLMPWVDLDPQEKKSAEKDTQSFQRFASMFRWAIKLGSVLLTEEGLISTSQYHAWACEKLGPMLESDRKTHPRAEILACVGDAPLGLEDRLESCPGWNEDAVLGHLKNLVGSEELPWVLQAAPHGSTLN